MAEITSYPTAAPKGGDYLLGAQVGEPGDNPANPTKKFTVASILALGTTPLVQHVQVLIPSADLYNFNTYPYEVELVGAPGENKAIVALNAAVKQIWKAGPIYDFNQDLRFAYCTPTGNTILQTVIPTGFLNLNQPGDKYMTLDFPNNPPNVPYDPIRVDSSFCLTANPGTTVTQGTADLVIDLLYRTVEFPT